MKITIWSRAECEILEKLEGLMPKIEQMSRKFAAIFVLDHEDFEQLAFLTLIQNWDELSKDSGNNFDLYALTRIKWAMIRFGYDNTQNVRIPDKKFVKSGRRETSIFLFLTQEGQTLGDVLPSEEDVVEKVEAREQSAILEKTGQMTARVLTKQILSMRRKGITRLEVFERLGLSREAVLQASAQCRRNLFRAYLRKEEA